MSVFYTNYIIIILAIFTSAFLVAFVYRLYKKVKRDVINKINEKYIHDFKYDNFLHSILGIFDSISMEEDLFRKSKKKESGNLFIQANIDLSYNRNVPFGNKKKNYFMPSRITKGSVSRDDVSKKFPFLREPVSYNNILPSLRNIELKSFYYRFYYLSNEGFYEIYLVDEFNPSEKSVDEFYFSVHEAVQGPIIVFYDKLEGMNINSWQSQCFCHSIKVGSIKVDSGSIVINEEGDIYGTVSDLLIKSNIDSQELIIDNR